MAVLKEIEALVAKFERNQNFYKSGEFNETEVKEEDSVVVEGKIKNPDNSFRLFDNSVGSMKREFFIEVKRSLINIESGFLLFLMANLDLFSLQFFSVRTLCPLCLCGEKAVNSWLSPNAHELPPWKRENLIDGSDYRNRL